MSFDACARLTEQGDPDRFRATMAVRPAARQVLFPLYAFNVEVSRAPWVTAEPMIAEMRLQWWHDALEEIAEGGLVRRHEVVTPLALMLGAEQARRLQGLVSARRHDIERAPFAETRDLMDYLRATSGTLMQVAAEALGAEDAASVADKGTAHGIAGYLRAVPELEARGKVPLVDGRAEGVRALAQTGLDLWRPSPRLSAEARMAALAGWQTPMVLAKAVSDLSAVAEGRLEPSPLRASLALTKAAWRL
ncbi:squalene/phytoene synthase family protein [Pseudaestuariivita sp.]|uniref:squalene/phytoene synthase family protein n=1 Tax=Pseudaestuariivita sp. TaxID=2211669 RepID=UPI004059216E